MRHSRFLCVLFFVLLSTFAYAQKSLSLLVGSDIGGDSKGYQFKQNGTVLKRGFHGAFGTCYSYGTKLHYQTSPHFGVEAGLFITNMYLAVYDPQFVQDHNLPVYKWNDQAANAHGYLGVSKLYFTPQLSLYGYVPLSAKKNISWYMAGGINYNYHIHNLERGDWVIEKSDNYANEHLLLDGGFSLYFMAAYLETGFKFGNAMPVYVGFKRTLGQELASAVYTRYKNGHPVSSDYVRSSGSYQALSIWAGLNLIYKSGREKASKTIKGRTLNVAATMTVLVPEITIQVWDDEDVDGDKISLNLNGRWILSKYVLEKSFYEFTASLVAGTNYLTLHADSQGKRKPCTVAILIDDGINRKKIILDSDFKQSSTIEINLEE